MTDPTNLYVDGFTFDRQSVYNLADRIDDHLWDYFLDAFMEMATNAVGERKPDEDEDDYDERVREAASTVRFLAIKALTDEADQYSN